MLKPAPSKLRPGRTKLRYTFVPKPRFKQVQPFYVSPEWRALIKSIKQQRGNYCHDPAHPPSESRTAKGRVYGDHIIELKDGGALLDPSNIMLRCHLCHQRKTWKERALRKDRGGPIK